LAKEEAPKTDWSLGAGDLYDQVLLLVLHDLSNDNNDVANILTKMAVDKKSVFGCTCLASNMKELVDFKMLHMHQLLGKDRYEVNRVYYPQDVENIKEKGFIPLYDTLMPYLKAKLGFHEI